MSYNYYTSFLHTSECVLPAYFYSVSNYLPIYYHAIFAESIFSIKSLCVLLISPHGGPTLGSPCY